ncbi:MAG: hypothetical protein AB7G75_12325 [Candidatus Binatia bacterium]
MKTFFEYFLDEVQRKLEAGEIEEETARRWVVQIKTQLQEYAESVPHEPLVRMPVTH